MGASSSAKGRREGALSNGRPRHSIPRRVPEAEYRCNRLPDHAVSGSSLATDGDALPPTFEVGGWQYPDTAILRNAFPGPAFGAPGLSIPAGLTRDGLPVGFEIDGLPGGDDQLLRLGMAIEAVLEPLPPPAFRNG
jgi:hypothetical protein